MSDQELSTRLSQWREAFDRSFAEPAVARSEDLQDYLAIRVAEQALALPLDQLSGLLPWREPTAYPLQSAPLLGLIGHQGGALPLFDLRALLGHGSAPAPAWIVLLKSAPLALAFEGFDGQWRLSPQQRLVQTQAKPGSLLGDAVRCGEQLRPLVDLLALRVQLETAHQSSTEE